MVRLLNAGAVQPPLRRTRAEPRRDAPRARGFDRVAARRGATSAAKS